MQAVLRLFDNTTAKILCNICERVEIREIRLRVNRPICITTQNGKLYPTSSGGFTVSPVTNSLITTKDQIKSVVYNACDGSVYAYQNQINNGFITIKGGHRIGICGCAVYTNGEISNITNFSGLNIRIARQFIGTAEKLFDVYKHLGLKNTLIVGAVGSGKTTVLRDISRSLAAKYNICVIDERCEICNCVNGVPAFDIGTNCDCLNGYKKADGIEIAIRTLSPDVIVFDEFSTQDELKSVNDCFNCGVNIIASIHAQNEIDFMKKSITEYILNQGLFECFVFLQNCQISKIIIGDEGLC